MDIDNKDNRMDNLLKSLFSEADIRTVKNQNFTRQVLRKVSLAEMENKYENDKLKQFWLGLLGLSIFGTFVGLLYVLWQQGIPQEYLPQWILELPVTELIARDGIKFVGAGLGIHLILSRGLLTYFMIKKPLKLKE